MTTRRFLVKLREDTEPATEGKETLRLAGFPPSKLFDVMPGALTLQQDEASSASASGTWYGLGVDPATIQQAGDNGDWDLAHMLAESQLTGRDANDILMVEPDLEQSGLDLPGEQLASAGSDNSKHPRPQKTRAPFVPSVDPVWHLDDRHSGLRTARGNRGDHPSEITIVHLDTGFDRNHVAKPAFIASECNFMDGENPQKADDLTPVGGWLTNRGHGTGTIGILAGPLLSSADPAELQDVVLGGAPFMQIVPVRIANSVVRFWTGTVAQGINHASDIRADVVSMSMGGLPSAAWADAVNHAYEQGIVVVCAAGYNKEGLPTSLTVYPARFQRVIAANGVMANDVPYAGLPTSEMEGNAGPRFKDATAISAPTPNIPWAVCDTRNILDLDGGGTSAATPQVAAAAALWLDRHGSKYAKGDWRRAEAARQALFRSARKVNESQQLVGQGVLQAHLALGISEPEHLPTVPKASAAFAFFHLLSSVFGIQSTLTRRDQMLAVEVSQLAFKSKAAANAMPDPDDNAVVPDDMQVRAFKAAILEEPSCSKALREHLMRG